jgi:hypothetical protein
MNESYIGAIFSAFENKGLKQLIPIQGALCLITT